MTGEAGDRVAHARSGRSRSAPANDTSPDIGVDPQLSGVYSPDRPGLPRGRSSLPREKAGEAQMLRLHRAVIDAIADVGYARVTVNDVVARARVSRREFYRNFADMQECFLSAGLSGGYLLYDSILRGMAEAGPAEALRGLLRGYLSLCATEPDFTHCLTTEIMAAGPEGLTLFVAARKQVAALMADAARQEAGAAGDDWGEDENVCLGAVGAVNELTITLIESGRLATAMDLEDVAVQIVRRVLGVRPTPVDGPP